MSKRIQFATTLSKRERRTAYPFLFPVLILGVYEGAMNLIKNAYGKGEVESKLEIDKKKVLKSAVPYFFFCKFI